MVLEEIEDSVPYQQIYIDKSQNKGSMIISMMKRVADIEAKAKCVIKMALDMGGNSREQVIENLVGGTIQQISVIEE